MIKVLICKKRLLILWLSIAGLLAIILIAQSFGGAFADGVVDHTEEAWRWFLPNVLPTLSLMIGVVMKDLIETKEKEQLIDPFVYHLSFGLSITYLLMLMASILLSPMFPNSDPLELMKQSSLWLNAMQGLVSLVLGVFFGKIEQSKTSESVK
jgi:hypothetical protein